MPTLGIFARRPIAGEVKTRLAASVGADAAARFYEVCLRTLLERVRSIPIQRVIALAQTVAFCSAKEHSPNDPSTSEQPPPLHNQWFQQFEGYELWSQPPGDLGLKLNAWFEFACDSDDRVLVIGSDSPTLPMEFIQQAVLELDAADCVIGPALDGGYYLLGLRRPAPELFIDIEWSSSRVLEQTLSKANELQLRVALLPPWNDVDEAADLIVLREQLKSLGSEEPWDQLQLEVEQMISDSQNSSHV